MGDRARLRARRRQRRQLPARPTSGSSTTGRQSVARPPARQAAGSRATRGSTRSSPTRPATPTTPTSRSCRTSTPTCSRAAARTTRSRRSCSRRAWCCSTARAAAAAGGTTATRWPGASSARAACRARRGATTWRTPTTPTGCRARASGSRASRAIIGGEGTQRLLRTRLAMTMAEQRLAGTDGLGRARLHARHAAARVLRQPQPDRRARARHDRRRLPASGRADLAEACTVLAAWDTRADVGSRGAVLWREFWARLRGAGVPCDDPVRPGRPGQHAAWDRRREPVTSPR